jgi:hypothetical protein
VPIGAREQQLAGIEFGRVVCVDIQHGHRHAATRRCRCEAVDLNRWSRSSRCPEALKDNGVLAPLEENLPYWQGHDRFALFGSSTLIATPRL